MKEKRIGELLALLLPAWEKHSELNLLQFIAQLAAEAGYSADLASLPDDVLIYHLKLRGSDKHAAIPGLKKDYETDFKTALLKARGVIKDRP